MTLKGINQNRKFKCHNFSMSNIKSDITNKITGIDIIHKSNVIFLKGTLPRTISSTQSKMLNQSKCRNVSKLNLPMSNSKSENVIRIADIDLLSNVPDFMLKIDNPLNVEGIFDHQAHRSAPLRDHFPTRPMHLDILSEGALLR